MSTQTVFDSKYNIVAVDPDLDQVIQIPGTEFQAPATKEQFHKISIIPDYEAHFTRAELKERELDVDPVTGRYNTHYIGVGVDMEIPVEDNYLTRLPEAYRFRVTNLHVGSIPFNNQTEVLKPEFDQYFISSGWRRAKINKSYWPNGDTNVGGTGTNVSPVAKIRCERSKWQAEGLSWIHRLDSNGDVLSAHYLDFNIEICTGAMVTADLADGTYQLENEPIGNLYTLPCRILWPALMD